MPQRISAGEASSGSAGVEAPLTLNREGDVFDVGVTTRDRRRFLKSPRLH